MNNQQLLRGATAAVTQESTRDAKIIKEIACLKNNVEDLTKSLYAFRDRLDPILAPINPSKPGDNTGMPAEPLRAPLHEELYQISVSIFQLRELVQDLRNRAEI